MPSPDRPTARRLAPPIVLAAAVFLLALGPRLWRIDAHLTPDELRWVCRTVGFHTGLATGDLGLTLQTGHPGVVTMWLGGLGLPTAPEAAWSKACLDSKSSELLYELADADRRVILERLYAGRRRIALATALMAAVIVWLAGRVFGRRTALAAAPLIALDPFWLAHSRFLHLDGVLTGLMTIALLALLLFLVGPVDAAYGSPVRRRWLVASGVALGLALAAKSPALFVVGYGGVLWLALAAGGAHGLRTMLGEGLLWLAAAAVTLVAVWPALWSEPLAVVRLVATEFANHGTATLERASFFAGQIRDDAGPMFYATVWWLRTSPWVVAGAAIAAWSVGGEIAGQRRGRAAASGGGGGTSTPRAPLPSDRIALRGLLGFAVLFTLFLTAASKEFDRYLLPAFPAADIAAAAGLVGAVEWVRRGTWRAYRAAGRARHAVPLRVGKGGERFAFVGVAGIVLATQAALVLPIGPYWVTWYDPLVGGAGRAQRLMLVGWGEGLDQMAAYLNAQPNASDLEVASRYRAAFGLLFDGRNVQTDDYDPDTTDYVVFMLNQVQRHQDPELLTKYMGVDPPAASAVIGGITLAWAYRNRADEPVRAYLDAHADPARDAIVVREGHILTRRYAGPLPVVTLPSENSEDAPAGTRDEPVRRRLVDAFARHRRVWYVHRAEGDPGGAGRDAARLLATSTRQGAGERLGDLVVESFEAPEGAPPTFARPQVRTVDVRFGAGPGATLRLVALGMSASPWPTDRRAAVDLTWRGLGADRPAATASVQLLDAAGRQRAQLDEKLVDGAGDPSDEWRADAAVATALALDVRGLPAGDYTLSIGAYTAEGEGDAWQGLGVLAGADLRGLAAAGPGAQVRANRLLVPVRLAGP
ncbi:MAG: phospholipid carrier-dependent glycosyltransferase [Anaerolineae bacterium]